MATKHGKKYRATVYVGIDPVTKKRMYEIFEDDDPDMADSLASAFRANKTRLQRPNNMTVGEAMDNYIECKTNILSPSTVREYKKIRKSYMQGIMDITLRNLSQERIQKEINKEAREHSAKTVQNMHGLLSATMGMYHPDFKLRTTLPKKRKIETNIPTDTEIKLILDNAKGSNYYIPILLAAFLGMRRSEICALKWTDINEKNKTLSISSAKVMDDNKKWIVKDTTKTYESMRKIRLSDAMIEAFSEYKHDGEYIVKIIPGRISEHFPEIVKKCGIERKIRFHDLRHYNASVMHKLHVPDKYAQRRGGWATDHIMKTVYLHTFESDFEEAENTINTYFDSVLQPILQPIDENTPENKGGNE